MGQDIVLQEYIRESKGRDIRAIVVGSRVVAVDAAHGQGGRVSLEPAPRRHRASRSSSTGATASAAVAREPRRWGSRSRASTCSRGASGPKILEINSSPGLEGIERASGVDVATAIVMHAERFVQRQRSLPKRELDVRISAAVQKERGVMKVRNGSRPRSQASAR